MMKKRSASSPPCDCSVSRSAASSTGPQQKTKVLLLSGNPCRNEADAATADGCDTHVIGGAHPASRTGDPRAYVEIGSRCSVNHSHMKRWGAAYLLVGLFLVSWGGQFAFGLIEARQEAEQHGQTFAMADFWATFLSATFENWQSEWLQLLVQAVVLLGMKHLIFAADAEDMEVVQRDLVEIKKALGLPQDNPGEHHQLGGTQATGR